MKSADNIVWHEHKVDKIARSGQKAQSPCIIWFTGFSGSGKSTVANALEQRLAGLNQHTYLLDGDNVRHGLNKDLGFSDADRVENIRRIGEMAKLFVDAGLIVLSAFISPFRAERRMVRELVEVGEFIEVYMGTPLSTCEQRDSKGLYQKARAGEIKNFTGIDSDYEVPEQPEVTLDTSTMDVEECVDQIISHLVNSGILPSLEQRNGTE
jgi:adenylylsulfate kinase